MCWAILKTFYNGKKIPVIALFLINNKLVSNFKIKADHFINSFFPSQYNPFSPCLEAPVMTHAHISTYEHLFG